MQSLYNQEDPYSVHPNFLAVYALGIAPLQ